MVILTYYTIMYLTWFRSYSKKCKIPGFRKFANLQKKICHFCLIHPCKFLQTFASSCKLLQVFEEFCILFCILKLLSPYCDEFIIYFVNSSIILQILTYYEKFIIYFANSCIILQILA